MIDQETASLGKLAVFASSQPAQAPATEISVVDLVALLLRRKQTLAISTLVITSLTAAIVYTRPPTYKAEAMILTPQQQQSSMGAMAAASGMMGAGMASQLGLKNPADLYLGLLKSRSISEAISTRFHLSDVYKTKLPSQTRKILGKHVTFEAGKDSLIKIAVEDHEPSRAANIANAYVEELYKQNSRLALSDASQRRLFFEEQLKREKDALATAEVELKKTQLGTGLLIPTGQAELLIRSGAQIRAEIASREVQLQSMHTFATDENPQVQVLRREIGTLQGQLNRVESSPSASGGLDFTGKNLPEATLLYVRKTREVKYHETLFELLAKQYEAARIDEGKQAPIIQVVDRATVPDSRYGPSRILLVIVAAIFGLVLSCLAILLGHASAKYISQIRQGAFGAPATS